MSWFKDNIVLNPFINQVGGIANLIRKDNGGDAVQRVTKWGASNPILPGCNGSLISDCNFKGTDADWQDLRTNYINNCTTANNRGFLTSKNKTIQACQALFDEKAQRIQLDRYAENQADYNYIKSLIGNDDTVVYVLIIIVIGIIIYLLF